VAERRSDGEAIRSVSHWQASSANSYSVFVSKRPRPCDESAR
jgi:hypothetical protein